MSLADEMNFGKWVAKGKGARLSHHLKPELVASLRKFNGNGLFTMDNVPDHGVVLSVNLKARWKMIFKEMAEKGDAEDRYSAAQFLDFMIWVEKSADADESKEVGLSKVAEQDCARHGAESVKDIAKLGLAIHLGRWPSTEETKSVHYGSPPQASTAAKMATKSKLQTFDTALTLFSVQKDLSPSEVFVSRMLEQWVNSPDPFAAKAAFLFNQW